MKARVSHVRFPIGYDEDPDSVDLETIFAHAVDRQHVWVYGTGIVGESSDDLARVARESGYSIWFANDHVDYWIAVREDLLDRSVQNNSGQLQAESDFPVEPPPTES